MQITDEMWQVAKDAYYQYESPSHFDRLRAALEAALGARKTKGEFVSHLLNWADVKEASCASYSTAIAREAAACIEDLAAALRDVASVAIIDDGPTAAPLPRLHDSVIVRNARAALERWGLK